MEIVPPSETLDDFLILDDVPPPIPCRGRCRCAPTVGTIAELKLALAAKPPTALRRPVREAA